MRRNVRRSFPLAILVLTVLAATPAAAQTGSLPDADALVDRYVKAIGGRERVLSAGSNHLVGTFSMPAVGMQGRMEVYAAPPNRVRVRMDLPGMGTIENGFDGEIAWAVGPMGPRVIEGAELEAAGEEANILAAVRDRSLFQSVETVERTEIDGEACYKVKFVWKSGHVMHDCYSVESGLLIASTVSRASPQGNVEMEQFFADYREFDGFMRPMRVVQRIMGQEQVITFDSVEIGPVPDSIFAPPAQVRALIDGARP